MPAPLDLDPTTSVATYFGSRLRRLRQAADLTQEQLGDVINYTGSLIGQIETARKSPTLEFARACDQTLNGGGELADLWKLLKNYPDWLDAYVEEEQKATAIETYEPVAISGLLQTPEYARAITRGNLPTATVERVERVVATRVDRQQIHERPIPPRIWFIHDESALLRPVGGPCVMKPQLERVLEMAARPYVIFQVLLLNSREHPGMRGPISIIETGNAPTLAYSESWSSAEVVREPGEVAEWRTAFNVMRAAALRPDESVELVARILEEKYS